MPEHAVIVHFPLSGETGRELLETHYPVRADYMLTPLERFIEEFGALLEKLVTEAGLGEYNGPDIEKGEVIFHLFGPDADALFAAVEPTLRESPLSANGWAIKHFGTLDDPECREEIIRFE